MSVGDALNRKPSIPTVKTASFSIIFTACQAGAKWRVI